MKRNKPLLFRIILFSVVFLHNYIFEVNAATINATSCEQTDVQAAIDSASNGDTAMVPAGECIWPSGIAINNKTINVIGAGIDQTSITRTDGSSIFYLQGEQACRISGFTFEISDANSGIEITGGADWRIDHCKFISDTYKAGVYGYGQPDNLFQGLVDHCTFHNCRVLHYGEPTGDTKYGKTRWFEDLNIGTDKAVYIEDCTFESTEDMHNAVDTNHGGRYVFRFNTLTNQHIEFHSVQGANRAARLFEIYNNTQHLEDDYPYYYPYRIRAGTGVIFGNTLTGSWYHIGIALDNVRSYRSVDPGGLCDGNSPWDGNEDATGWPCRDQIGRSTDEWLWTPENPYPPQASAPAYLWLNRVGENILPAVVINSSGDHIKNNRDYYDEAASFDGSSGTGWGTLANRPTTCTPGVAYWATDQGYWNQNGDDGVLYKCTSTNTWEVYYIPYTYPHPLITNGTTPEPVINVYPNPCRVYQGENSVTFFGDLSIGDNIKIFDMSGKIVHNSGDISKATYEWGVSDIASGIYPRPSVRSGIYFFVVKSSDGNKKASGKIAVIR